MHELGWDSWVRTIRPEEVPVIRDALCAIDESRVRAWAVDWRRPHGADGDDDLRYVLDYLRQAQEFVESLARDGRGMVYLIG
ncbi:YfbM family protein [Agromyces larvae]|uniref:YfbM family protein n=1 Tax=Agromyces larvae TaxID=2929802 RepID=A0ABY4C1M1_9MICO|nr:YfbM family protein [Agromyces larvae]UOE44041.1 YfbM family protein [Agromyces larvae]